MESKKNCKGLNEASKPHEDRANPLQDIDKLYDCCCDILQDVIKLKKDVRESSSKVIEDDFATIYKRFGDLDSVFDYVKTKAQRLAEENRRLKEKREPHEQRGKDTTIPPREAREQRKREISQKRREAVNARWSKARANAEASTNAESYKAANAVSVQSQNIVPCTARNAATESGKKTLLKTYRPTHAQVAAFMRNRLKVRADVAEEEAQSFLDYYNARDWEIRGTAIADWEACARSWIKKAERYNGKGIYEPQGAQEKPITEAETQRREEKGENGLVVTIVERMRKEDYTGTTGATAREVKEMIDTGIYSNDWKGELARKVCDYPKAEAQAPAPETFCTVVDAESYTVADAESAQVQIIVPYTAQAAARNTYRPTEAQVCEYMQSYFCLPKDFAEEEARKFFDYYSANGWTMKGVPIADWEACARNWVNRAVAYMDKQQRQRYEGLKNYLGAIRSIEEDAEYERIHGKEELPF